MALAARARFHQRAAPQFKEFHSREPTQVFGAVKGFYVRYNEDIPDACVKLWNVQHIGLSRKSRHLDRVAQKQVRRAVRSPRVGCRALSMN
jgi:hypothetical protein